MSIIGRRDSSGRIDLTDPNNLSNKVLDEKTTRKKLLARAREEGYEKDMLMLFAKYDKMLRLATSDKERKDIAQFATLEAYKLMGAGGELYIDGQLVYKS
jgi:hypothetical protein